MTKWAIYVNDGAGWEICNWTRLFDSEREANEFIWGDDEGESWQCQVKAVAVRSGK